LWQRQAERERRQRSPMKKSGSSFHEMDLNGTNGGS
jgi:hypothetical protein